MRHSITVIVLLSLLTPALARAQDASSQTCLTCWVDRVDRIAQDSAAVDPMKRTAVVSLPVEGPMRAALRREGARLTQSQPPVSRQQSWIARHPVIVSTLIGTGVGAALSRTDAVGGYNHDPSVTLIGTGGGALAGLVASVVQKNRAGDNVGLGTKVALVSSVIGAVTLTVMCASYCGGN